MLFTFFVGLVVFALLYVWLLIHRFRVAWLEDGSTTSASTTPSPSVAPRRDDGSDHRLTLRHQPWVIVAAGGSASAGRPSPVSPSWPAGRACSAIAGAVTDASA